MNNRIRTCFISAAAGTNLDTLREVLAERGVEVLVPDFKLGVNLADEITSTLQRADLVIGVLGRTRRSDSVLFELGQANALGKQIVLISAQTPFLMTSDLQRFQVVRARPSNREAISFALDQVLASPPPSRHHFTPKTISKPIGQAADALIQQLTGSLNIGNERQLEELTATALRQAGVEVFAAAKIANRRVDLAIWSDALQPILGNPLLVEIKSRLSTGEALKKASTQLSGAVEASGSMWGLLLYGEGPTGSKWQSTAPRNVLIYSLAALFEEMRSRPFEEIVTNLRNKRVHGVQS